MAVIPSPSALVPVYLGVVLAVWTARVFLVARIRKANSPLEPRAAAPASPKVTVIVPARDEEKNIRRCLESLFAQEYPDYEVIVVDDRSADATPAILEEEKRRAPVTMRAVRVEKLPPGWTGKNHAMHVGSRAATGDWLLFTDADTFHSPKSLSTAVATALEGGVDLLTLAPEAESRSFWEKTVQPLAVTSLAVWFDPFKVNDDSSGVTLANGQFILVKKSVYDAAGGSEAVKNAVVEDVEFAVKVREKGFRVRFLNGTKLYRTRMYSSLAEIRRGWTRILTYLFKKNAAAILHKIFLFLAFSIGPFVALAWALVARPEGLALPLAAAACGLIVALRAVGNTMVKTNPFYAVLHPLGSLVMVWILCECLDRIWKGKGSPWRGDVHA